VFCLDLRFRGVRWHTNWHHNWYNTLKAIRICTVGFAGTDTAL
jgi:hypothetical protein